MEPNAPRAGRPLGRALLTVAVVVGLLAVVALAATGKTPVGTAGTRRPSDRLLDVLLSLFLVVMACGSLIFVYLLVLRRDVMRQRALLARRKSKWRTLVLLAVVFVVLAAVVRVSSERFQRGEGTQLPGVITARGQPRATTPGNTPYEPRFEWLAVALVLGAGTVAAAAVYLAARARRKRLPPLDPSSLAEALADVLELSLDDLREERDPRKAVVAAYARLERTLAAYGLPRRPAEAPFEYLGRMLADLAVSSVSIRRLTVLFERAKFSQHEVPPEMKDEAIDALETVQFELRAAEIRAAEERAAALAAARERAAG